MAQQSRHNKKPFDRRRFIGHGIKLTLLAGILSPLEQSCNTKSKGPKNTTDRSTTKNNNNSKRHKWNAERLVINTKTNVIHLPTASFYVYYDEIKNLKNVTINNWEDQVRGEPKFNKNKSGNILEILSLQKLKNGINDNSLNSAVYTLSIAFTKECENAKGINLNTTNYRLHELMLQLIALNTYIPYKWKTFNDMVSKPQKIGRRQKWMADEASFNERVKYIQDHEANYKDRLSKRASKYNLT